MSPLVVRRTWVALLTVLATASCALPKETLPPAPPAAQGAAPGGMITVGITAPAGVDPLSFGEPAGMLIGSVLCETLVTVDPETGHLKPGLAQKWTITDDGARVIVQLRKDAYFHDGRPVRSIDILESLSRLANPDFASHSAGLMGAVRFIEQFRAAVEEGLPSPTLAGIRIIEPYSFEIFLRPKNPDFLRALAHPATAPVSKSPFDNKAEDALSRPQCAGPYRLDAPYVPGAKEIVLKRFEQYNGRNVSFSAGGKGYADEIRFQVYPSADAVYEAFVQGAVDVAGVPSSRVTDARARFGPRLVFGNLPHGEFIGLPHGADSPFTDRRARVALSQALDRTALVRDVYGDAHEPARGFIPPALITEPPPRTGKGDVRRVDFDGCGPAVPQEALPGPAQEAWAESKKAAAPGAAVETGEPGQTPAPPTEPPAPGVGAVVPATPPAEGQALKLYFNDESTHRKLAEHVAAQWREVLGIAVEPTPLNWDAFLQKATVGSGFDGPFRLSHAPTYASAQPFLGSLFLSGNTSRSNLARFNSPAFDAAYGEDMRPTIDEQERLLRYKEAESLLCGEMPIIPVAFARSATLFSERLTSARASGRLVSRIGEPMLREVAVSH